MGSMPVFGWVLLAIGAVLVVGAAASLLTTRAFVSCAARAEATVTITERELKSAEGAQVVAKARFWVAEFQDRKGLRQQMPLGESMEAKLGPLDMGMGDGKSLPAAGTKIGVLFDPRNPLRVRRDSFRELWLLPAGALAAGIVCLALAAALWSFAP